MIYCKKNKFYVTTRVTKELLKRSFTHAKKLSAETAALRKC